MGKNFSTGLEKLSHNLLELPKVGGHGWSILYPKIQMLKPDHPFPMMAISRNEAARTNELKRVGLRSNKVSVCMRKDLESLLCLPRYLKSS